MDRGGLESDFDISDDVSGGVPAGRMGQILPDKKLILINTNARSLCPKINSLIDCLTELEASIGVITETWLREGDGLTDDEDDFEAGTGYGMVNLCRKPGSRGVSHGGVSVVFRKIDCDLRRIPMENRGNFEVLPTVGSIRGYSRKIVVVGCYIPPNYPVQRAQACLDHITDVVLESRRKYSDPFIVVAGDFNQWDIGHALRDYADITEEAVGPTRGSRCIDRVFTNFVGHVRARGTLPPLESDCGSKKRDHLIAFVEASLPKKEAYKVLKYTYRYYNEDSAKKFTAWAVGQDWEEVLCAVGSNAKAEAYQRMIEGAMDSYFPTITTVRKSTDPPWVNGAVKKRVKQRRSIYRKEGRSSRWRRMKAVMDKLVK